MKRWQVITLAAAMALGAGAAGAQTATTTPTAKPAKKSVQPAQPAAATNPRAVNPAKPFDPTVGIGGLQFKRQEFDSGRSSGTRYQSDLTRRKDLYLYGGSSTPGERRPGDVPASAVDQTRPAGTTFGGGVGVRF